MKRFFLKYWWTLIVALALLMATSIGATAIMKPVLGTALEILMLLDILALIVSQIVLLCNKKWWAAILSLLLSCVVFFLLLIPMVMVSLFTPYPDSFGKDHPIPEGLEYNIPISRAAELPTADSLDADTWLQLQEDDHQGGIYTYTLCYSALPAGEVFLRCYEVTEDIPVLPIALVRNDSRVEIDSSAAFSQVVGGKEFFIHYGDWGDYYAARFEVWHRNAVTGEETKLLEKIYRVEGWMR